MLDDDTFRAGTHTTKYLDQELADDALDAAVARWGTDEVGGDASAASTDQIAVEVDGKRFDVVVTDGLPRISRDGNASGGSGSGTSGGNSSGGGTVDVTTSGAITAEMQGTILSTKVAPGDDIAAGDVVCVLEAMKMENDVVASAGGTVASVPVAEGDSVDMGDTLVVLEE
jgi:acetyl-CoA/propionyl-CoA carboxylase biotin carboxyl carrier protein